MNSVTGSPIVSPFFRESGKIRNAQKERGPGISASAKQRQQWRHARSEVFARHEFCFALDQEQARFQFILEMFNPLM